MPAHLVLQLPILELKSALSLLGVLDLLFEEQALVHDFLVRCDLFLSLLLACLLLCLLLLLYDHLFGDDSIQVLVDSLELLT